MSARAKPNLFLVHQGTGQRYPVDDELVLGRSGGDILFPDDPKVSGQHCRVLKTPRGLAVHDLESSNGTSLDGIRLDPKKIYLFKLGQTLTLGGQALKLQELMVPKRTSRRRKKKGGLDFQVFLAALLILAGLAVFARLYVFPSGRQPAAATGKFYTPLEMVEMEMRVAFDAYTEIGQSHTRGAITDKQLSRVIRKTLLPRLQHARVKMDVLIGQSEWEKRKIEANKKLLAAVIGQVSSMASYAETKVPKFAKDVEKFSAQVEILNAEVHKLNKLRKPAAF